MPLYTEQQRASMCSFCGCRDSADTRIPEEVCRLRDSARLCEVCIKEAKEVLARRS